MLGLLIDVIYINSICTYGRARAEKWLNISIVRQTKCNGKNDYCSSQTNDITNDDWQANWTRTLRSLSRFFFFNILIRMNQRKSIAYRFFVLIFFPHSFSLPNAVFFLYTFCFFFFILAKLLFVTANCAICL